MPTDWPFVLRWKIEYNEPDELFGNTIMELLEASARKFREVEGKVIFAFIASRRAHPETGRPILSITHRWHYRHEQWEAYAGGRLETEDLLRRSEPV